MNEIQSRSQSHRSRDDETDEIDHCVRGDHLFRIDHICAVFSLNKSKTNKNAELNRNIDWFELVLAESMKSKRIESHKSHDLISIWLKCLSQFVIFTQHSNKSLKFKND